MSNVFEEVLDLIAKTGDRCIVTDVSGQHANVVMSLNEYKRLLDVDVLSKKLKEVDLPNKKQELDDDLTGDDLLNRINQDIAVWRSVQNKPDEIIPDEPLLSASSEISSVQKNVAEIANLPIITTDESLIEEGKENKEDSEKYYFEPVDSDVELT